MSEDLLKNVGQTSVLEFLNRLHGKTVTLYLDNGQSITGDVVGDIDYSDSFVKTVHLTKLQQSDFFDAVIPKQTVVGVVFRRPTAQK